jgi:catechol 2,3-dioxygenase-like lactoylglutathione lyase family enzyme
MGSLGIQKLKVIALAVADLPRAMRFYGETLGLPPAFEGARQVGFSLGNAIVMLKSSEDGWYALPTDQLNPRITLATDHAPDTERELRARGVAIANPVQPYPAEGFHVGSFLDSEGNRIWFCSPIEEAETNRT